jgi:hypothetical protein
VSSNNNKQFTREREKVAAAAATAKEKEMFVEYNNNIKRHKMKNIK